MELLADWWNVLDEESLVAGVRLMPIPASHEVRSAHGEPQPLLLLETGEAGAPSLACTTTGPLGGLSFNSGG